MGDAVGEQKKFNAQLSQKIYTVENPLEQTLDGLKNDFEHKWDNLQDSIEDLIDKKQCPPEEECLSDTMVEKHSEQQLQEEMIEDFVEVVEGLSESSNIGVAFWPWKKEEQIIALITEEGSEKEEIEEPQKPITQATNSTLHLQTQCIAWQQHNSHQQHNSPLKHPPPRPPHHCLCCKTLED